MNPISEDRIKDTLTVKGYLPSECCFLAEGIIYRWGPKSRLAAIRIEDNELYRACKEYLRQHGKEFASLDEAIAIATRDKWPNWEKLPRPPEDGQRKESIPE